MNKAELKAKWSDYCDTDKLVDTMMALLTKYHHRNTEHGVCTMLDTYFTNKQSLIDMFKASDNYIGDMRIVVDIELERGNDRSEVERFCYNFPRDVDAGSAIFKYTDENGKTINDYLKTGIITLKAKDLLEDAIRSVLTENKESRSKFLRSGVTVASNKENDDFTRIMNNFAYHPESRLTDSMTSYLEQYKINGGFTAGMKTGRAFNRVCTHYGVNSLPNYNKLFATYSDMVSGLKRKLKFFISLNPLDYLTMSFGRSWASCHTIDTRNERRMPNDYSGMYCGGTLSYMLDKTSIITYVHDNITDDVEEGKIYRNMFHYENGALIQGRIYPQGNDGATDLYKIFRNVVQKELGKLIGLTDVTWTKKSGGCANNTQSAGVHYQDYLCFNGCNVSYPNEMPDSRNVIVHIGHNGICAYCGLEMDSYHSGRLAHSSCQ